MVLGRLHDKYSAIIMRARMGTESKERRLEFPNVPAFAGNDQEIADENTDGDGECNHDHQDTKRETCWQGGE